MDEKQSNEAFNTHGDVNIPPGQLSSPHIRYCVEKYKILENYEDACMDSATYHMRLGGKVLTWEAGKKVGYTLGKCEDKKNRVKRNVILQPNSLTFVTTIEKFNLPKDIIARFNLKSKWVHQGILLGTGPIVDPELVANLLIPLHNFSSQPIEIGYEEKIISVEFTKTLNPDDTFEIGGKNFTYEPNRSRFFDFDGYRKRITDKKVESSVSSTFQKYDKDFKKYKTRLTQFTVMSAIAILAAFIGLVTLAITTYSVIDSARKEVNEAKIAVSVYKDQILSSKVTEIRGQFDQIERFSKELKGKLIENNINATQIIELQETMNKIKEIENRLLTLERQQKNIETQ